MRGYGIGPCLPQRPLLRDAVNFWRHVERTETCWLWRGVAVKGYGRFNLRGKVWPAHRMSLFFAGTQVPAGMQVDHLCYQPSCVRPSHLEVVTPEVNLLRARDHRRRVTPSKEVRPRAVPNAAKTHCRYGHRFTPETTYHPRKGHPRRMCLICLRTRDAARPKAVRS